MKHIEIEKIVNRILSGKQLIEYEDTLYELRNADINIKLQANMLYDKEYEDNLYSDVFILEEDIEDLLLDLKLIYPEYKNDLDSLGKKLDNLKVDLFLNFFDRTKRLKYQKEIESTRKRYSQLYTAKQSLNFLTLENYCANLKNEFIILNTLFFYNTGNIVFNSSYMNYRLFNNITQIISNNILDISVIKCIARSDYWRNYYTINKNHLFPYSVMDFSEEQKAILSVSVMYDRVYEHPDSPDKDIIEDDDALEGWMIHQQRQNKKQKQEKGVNNLLSNKNMKNANEVFLMAGNKEQKEDILGLNSTESKMKLQNKISTVMESDKPIADCFLPDVQQDIKAKLKEISFKK